MSTTHSDRNRGTIAAGVAALLIAVGGTTGYLVGHVVGHASSASSSTAASPQQQGGGTGGGPGGGPGGGDLGFQPTAYHLDGTITALGNGTVTIATTTGTTTTYTVTGGTHLVSNGSRVGSLSSFAVGDRVRGSTTTQGGTTLDDLVSGGPAGPGGS